MIGHVSLEEMKRNVQIYLQRVQDGETIVVTKGGEPMAEIKPVASRREPRPFGLCAGEFTVPDDFDAPLPESILREFEGT